MGFKLRHTSAARMLADSALHMSPLHNPEENKPGPNLDEVQYFGVDSKKYQSSLADRAKTNPEGYFSLNTNIEGLGTQMYDKKFYSNVDGVPTLNEGYSFKDGRLTLNAPKTTDVNRKKPTNKSTKNLNLSGSGDNKGSVGDLPTTGNLQGQDWGDVKNTTIGHGEKSKANKVSDVVGVGSNLKGEYTEVNTGKDKKPASSSSNASNAKGPQNKDFKVIDDGSKNKNKTVKPNPYAKAKAKDSNLDQYIKDRNSAEKGSVDYAFAQNQINKAYGVDKKHEAKLERMETKGPQPIESKMQRTVTSAMNPSFDNIASRTGKGGDDRYTKMSKRQEKRTQKALGTYVKPESARQERKNLLTDNPVDKDATGGRYKNDRATKKLVKETSKQAKKDNAMKDAKAAVEAGDKKALRKSGVAGKFKRAGRQDIAAANKQKKESAKQERKDLLADMPVDKDATGGRAGTFDYSQSKKQNKQRYK